MTNPSLFDQVRELVHAARDSNHGTSFAEDLQAILDRLDEPLRVAIAGKVKAGKSTLLNALVGQELAPTDAGECTKIVTWYRDGVSYQATLYPRDAPPRQVPFTRDGGPVEVDLGGFAVEDIDRLLIDWPSASLNAMTLIDTPGIGSLTGGVSERTHAFLAPGEDEVGHADAVLYLMRHLHATDVRFLEAFHDDEVARAATVNTIGVLSRADEVGAGKPEAMESARRIADRYRRDPRIGRLCQTVIPVAGLLAQSGRTLREQEFQAVKRLAGANGHVESLLLSADRFVRSEFAVELGAGDREELLRRLGLFGIRLAIDVVRREVARSATELSRALVDASGLHELQEALASQFAARAGVLKARSALLAFESALDRHDVPGTEALAAVVERIRAGAHEFAEIRLLGALRAGTVRLPEGRLEEAERLLGSFGFDATARLGLAAEAGPTEIRTAAQNALVSWRMLSESPMSSLEVKETARILARTCEGLLIMLGRP
jgi:hypothetical protein